jgi:hypothetical protein
MATICVLEFDSINEATGEPMWPPTQVTAAQAFGAALALQATTRYVAVTPDANCRVRVSQDGAAPTTGFPQILASDTVGLHVKDTSATYQIQAISG